MCILYFGSQPPVVLSDNEAVKEALTEYGSEFIERGSFPIFEKISKEEGKYVCVYVCTGKFPECAKR